MTEGAESSDRPGNARILACRACTKNVKRTHEVHPLGASEAGGLPWACRRSLPWACRRAS